MAPQITPQPLEYLSPTAVKLLAIDREILKPRRLFPLGHPTPLRGMRDQDARGLSQTRAQVHIGFAHPHIVIEQIEQCQHRFEILVHGAEVVHRPAQDLPEGLDLPGLGMALEDKDGGCEGF